MEKVRNKLCVSKQCFSPRRIIKIIFSTSGIHLGSTIQKPCSIKACTNIIFESQKQKPISFICSTIFSHASLHENVKLKSFFKTQTFPLKPFFFSISVVDIKEELEDAAHHVKIEPEMKPLLITGNGFNGANFSIDEIDIKEEPLQDDLVSEFYNNLFSQFF